MKPSASTNLRRAAKLGHEPSQDLAVGFLEFGGRLWYGFVRLLAGLNQGAQQAEGGGLAGIEIMSDFLEEEVRRCLACRTNANTLAGRATAIWLGAFATFAYRPAKSRR